MTLGIPRPLSSANVTRPPITVRCQCDTRAPPVRVQVMEPLPAAITTPTIQSVDLRIRSMVVCLQRPVEAVPQGAATWMDTPPWAGDPFVHTTIERCPCWSHRPRAAVVVVKGFPTKGVKQGHRLETTHPAFRGKLNDFQEELVITT